MRRRELLKATVVTAAAAAVPSLFGCTDDEALSLTVFALGAPRADVPVRFAFATCQDLADASVGKYEQNTILGSRSLVIK